jgi:hypothetical protein
MRALFRRYRHFALVLLVLAFFVRGAIPAGYMAAASPDRIMTVSICADASGGMRQMEMVIPGKAQGNGAGKSAKAEGQCAFSALSHAALGGADAVLLALAFAFILILGFAPLSRLPFRPFAHLRPPLRGPPAAI